MPQASPALNDARLQAIQAGRRHKCPFLVPSSAELSSFLVRFSFLFAARAFPLIFILLRFLLAFFEISFCSARVELSRVESCRVESVLIYSIPYIFIELRHIHLLAIPPTPLPATWQPDLPAATHSAHLLSISERALHPLNLA